MSNALLSRSEAAETGLLEAVEAPFPHVMQNGFIDSVAFAQLRDSFPECPPSSGPTGFSLYWKDDGYQQLLGASPAWRGLFDRFHSQTFIDWAGLQFASEWKKAGCRIDLTQACYVPYHEDRIDKERATLRKVEHAPHELWVRMDIYQGRVGYSRAVHVDHARRLLTMLLYFSDHTDDGMTGGELLLHASPWKRWLQPATAITPRENLMIAFPCSDRSHHSVAKIVAARHPRNYVQVQISSSVDAWPRGRS